ncbi:unnamed protein product [Polarella glacialis]|uniref:Uncharacterized protein n=1 Tax=Polarella glacialis TaxID=89957 RepID=A0A813KCY4_POLGL|nr:unnamed protein product [Polarella glacialis]
MDLAELEELKALLLHESMERRRLECQLEPLVFRLTELEAQAARLGLELRETGSQRDELQRQIARRQAESAKLVLQCRAEQDTRRSVDTSLASAGRLREELEVSARQARAERTTAELEVERLQRQLGKMLLAEAQGDEAAHSATHDGDLFEQLRQQLEATARAAVSAPRQQAPQKAPQLGLQLQQPQLQQLQLLKQQQLRQQQAEAAAASERQWLPSVASLSHLETTSPCSSVDESGAGGVAASSDAEDAGRQDQDYEEELRPQPGGRALGGRLDFSPCIEVAGLDDDVVVEVVTPAWGTSSGSRNMLVERPEQQDVSEGQPQARSAGTLSLSVRDLSELKALKKPPPPLRMLMEICCILFDIPPVKSLDENGAKRFCYDYWEPARRFLLSDSFFLAKLRALEAAQVPPGKRSKIRRYFRDPHFSAERVSTCSKAALELYNWVQNLVESPPVAPLMPP